MKYKIFFILILLTTTLFGCSYNNITKKTKNKHQNYIYPSVTWKTKIGKEIDQSYTKLSPIQDNSIIYASDREGIIKSIELNSGNTIWSVNLLKIIKYKQKNITSLLISGLKIFQNNCYIVTETGNIISLNKTNGNIIWIKNIKEEISAIPTITYNTILIYANNGKLYSLDTKSGKHKWSVFLGNLSISIRGKPDPLIVYDKILVGDDYGRINEISIKLGEITWQKHIYKKNNDYEVNKIHNIKANIEFDIYSRNIFAIAYNGDLLSINIHSKKTNWRANIGSVNNISVSYKKIYIVNQNNEILSINKNNGKTIWTQNLLSKKKLTSPIIYKNHILLGDDYGVLYFINNKNGNIDLKIKIDNSGILNLLTTKDERILLQTRNGNLFLIKN